MVIWREGGRWWSGVGLLGERRREVSSSRCQEVDEVDERCGERGLSAGVPMQTRPEVATPLLL